MKKLLLLLLFIPLVSCQNDFRKMFWGESQEVLKEKYPEQNIKINAFGGKPTLIRQPYLQMVRPKTTTITWKTNAITENCFVVFSTTK